MDSDIDKKDKSVVLKVPASAFTTHGMAAIIALVSGILLGPTMHKSQSLTPLPDYVTKSEVNELRNDLNSLRNSMNELNRSVGILIGENRKEKP